MLKLPFWITNFLVGVLFLMRLLIQAHKQLSCSSNPQKYNLVKLMSYILVIPSYLLGMGWLHPHILFVLLFEHKFSSTLLMVIELFFQDQYLINNSSNRWRNWLRKTKNNFHVFNRTKINPKSNHCNKQLCKYSDLFNYLIINFNHSKHSNLNIEYTRRRSLTSGYFLFIF